MSILPEKTNLKLSGQIAKQWIYWDSNKKLFGVYTPTLPNIYKRPYKIPYDPKTINQRKRRATFYYWSQKWHELTEEQQEEYNQEAKNKRLKMTGYNYYMSLKLKEVPIMVKTIQNGTATLDEGIHEIEISEIDADRSIILVNSYGADFGLLGGNERYVVGGRIKDSTHIEIETTVGFGEDDVKVYWQVVEFY